MSVDGGAHERAWRLEKAVRMEAALTACLDRMGFSADPAARAEFAKSSMTDLAWDALADAAGVRPASAETREVVARLLGQRVTVADPIEGLPA